MRAVYLRKAIAGVSIISGVVVFFAVLVVPALWLISRPMKASDLFFLPISAVMSIPCVFTVIHGVKLFREMSEASLKWVLGIFSVCLAFWIAAALSLAFPLPLPERVGRDVFLTLGISVALPVYLFAMRGLLPLFGGPRRGALDFVGYRVLLIMAWQFFLLLCGLFEAYGPGQWGEDHIREEPWRFVGFIVPAVVAYGLFRAAKRWLSRRLIPPELPAILCEPR